jgi:hypothetical protein
LSGIDLGGKRPIFVDNDGLTQEAL